MTTLSTAEILSAAQTVVESSTVSGGVDGLLRCSQIIDPRRSPSPEQDRAFSVMVVTLNVGQRDNRDQHMRLRGALTIRCAWLLNPMNQASTWALAQVDAEAAVRGMMTDTETDLRFAAVEYTGTTWVFASPWEWIFADLAMVIEYNSSLRGHG